MRVDLLRHILTLLSGNLARNLFALLSICKCNHHDDCDDDDHDCDDDDHDCDNHDDILAILTNTGHHVICNPKPKATFLSF